MAVGGVQTRPGPLPHIGDALSVSTALWYGLYFLAVRSARQTDSTSRVMLWSCLVGAPLLLAAAFAMGETILPATLLGPPSPASASRTSSARARSPGPSAGSRRRPPRSPC
jgi:drug/metabolite transporter (DMT)-like permease